LDLLRRDPAEVVLRVSTNARSVLEGLWRRWPFLPPLVLLALAGLIQAARDPRRRGDVVFLAAMALPPLAFLPILVQVRFFAPMAPVFLLFAAAASTRLGDAWARRAGRPRLRHAPATLLALGLAALGPPVFLKGQRSLDFGPKSTGPGSPPTHAAAKVMARDPAIALRRARIRALSERRVHRNGRLRQVPRRDPLGHRRTRAEGDPAAARVPARGRAAAA
jgi:hypothetical protein